MELCEHRKMIESWVLVFSEFVVLSEVRQRTDNQGRKYCAQGENRLCVSPEVGRRADALGINVIGNNGYHVTSSH